MKRLIISLSVTVLLFTALFLLPVSASADRVYDPAEVDMLTDAEEAYLEERMEALSSQYGVQFYFATYEADGYRDDYIGDEYCRDIRDLWKEDAVLLIVTYDTYDGKYYYDMYTYGAANSRIRSPEVNYVLDHDDVYGHLKGGEIKTGAEAFFEQSGEAYVGRVGASYAIIVPVCLVIALCIALGVCAGVVASYRQKRASVDYPLDRFAKLELTGQSDAFITKTVSRTYVPRNNSRSGGGSSHGGGGGHRGGR